MHPVAKHPRTSGTRLCGWLLVWLLTAGGPVASQDPVYLKWSALPSLPGTGTAPSAGLAGHFSGVHQNALIVAGGTAFADGSLPWNGGQKLWSNSIRVLEETAPNEYAWIATPAKLPRPLAYGASVSTPEGVVCIGGADSTCYHRDVFRLSWNPQTRALETEALPPLPVPLAYAAAAVLGSAVYVAGGESSPQTHAAATHFFRLQLGKPGSRPGRWESLRAWPGPARLMPVLAVQNDGERDCVYLFSGRAVKPGGESVLLSDGYRYDPVKNAWRKLADVQLPGEAPRCVVGAPGIRYGLNHVLVFGGADNAGHRQFRRTLLAYENAPTPVQKDSLRLELTRLAATHRGFSRDILAYHTLTDAWLKVGELPEAGPVNTGATRWGTSIVIPSGETGPAARSPNIWKADAVNMNSALLGTLDYAMIGLYFLAVVWIGVRFSGRTKNTNDYYKAGGRVPGWVSGVAIFGTLMSSVTFLTTPSKTFNQNWLYYLPTISSLVIAPVIVRFILPVYVRLNITTAYEYLEKRFNPVVRLLGSLSFLSFRIFKIGILLLLPSLTIAAITGMDVVTCVLIIGLFSTVYCALGGIEAVVWTEVLQVFVLLTGALLSFVTIAVETEGGVAGLFALSQRANKLEFIDFNPNVYDLTVFVVVGYWIGGGLVPYTSDQAVIQKYLTTKDEKSAAKGVWVNAFIIVTSSFLFFAIGTALFAFYKTHPTRLNPALDTPESIFPWFIVNELPAGVKGMVIAGVCAAAMSSLNTSMNSMSSAVVTDFIRFRGDVSAKTGLRLAKLLSGFFGLVGTGLAVLLFVGEVGSLWDLTRKLTGLLTGGLAGLFLLGIFTKRANTPGAVIGFATSSLLQYVLSAHTAIHFMLYSLTGLSTCFLVGYVASLLFPPTATSLNGLTLYTLGKTGTAAKQPATPTPSN